MRLTGDALPSCFISYCKQVPIAVYFLPSFHILVVFLVVVVVILLFKMVPKHRADVFLKARL